MDPSINQEGAESNIGPSKEPDIMNDPIYDPNVKDQQTILEEPDTCRICRGEATSDEPLFYPCKCSGSIKFVHQHCLMEWLSHSQKKHCELCKTPFRFTKLYDHNMPSTVPLPIFLRQAAVHTWKSVVTSSRLLLVIFVWTAWLPWCMRTIWRGLFWIGDGAWADWTERRLQRESVLSTTLATEGTSPARSGLLMSKEFAATALVDQISNALPKMVPSIKQLFYFPTRQPLALTAIKKIYAFFFGGGTGPDPLSTPIVANASSHAESNLRSMWLTQIQFLNSLSRSSTLNNMVIDAFEGQLITLFVVIAFILIFLIREWVVQQQPIFNGAPDIDAQVDIARNQNDGAQQQNAEGRPQVGEGGLAAEPVNEGQPVQGPRARVFARARPRRPQAHRRLSDQQTLQNRNAATNEGSDTEPVDAHIPALQQPTNPQDETPTETPTEHNSQRPVMPDRDTLAKAAEIRRTLEEHSPASGVNGANGAAMEIFKDLWDRAAKQPLAVNRIIEEEGRMEELAWIVEAMNNIEDQRKAANSAEAENVRQPEASADDLISSPHENGEELVVLQRPSQNATTDPDVEQTSNPVPPLDSSIGNTSSEQIPSTGAVLENKSTRSESDAVLHTRPELPDPEAMVPSTACESTEGYPSDNDRGDLNSLTGPSSSSNDNPFHPDYEGDLEVVPDRPHSAGSNEEITAQPEAEQPGETPDQASNTPRPAPGVDEPPEQRARLIERIVEWLWGGVNPAPPTHDQPAGDDERIVGNIADEAPFVPVDHGLPLRLAANEHAVANQDPEVVAAAVQAGIDPNQAEGADDLEDLEGILELIGMQGPLAGLVQNGMFCACLVSLTILFGVWVPYMSGKMFLVLLAHPVSILFRIPLRFATSTADVIIDTFTFLLGCTLYWTDTLISMICIPITWLLPSFGIVSQNKIVAQVARSYAESALWRLGESFNATEDVLSEMDVPVLSLMAHESLRSIQLWIAWIGQTIFDQVMAIFSAIYHSSSFRALFDISAVSFGNHVDTIRAFIVENIPTTKARLSSFLHIHPLQMKLSLPQRTTPIDYDLAQWNIRDRALAVLFGYLFFALIAVVYLRFHLWMKDTNRAGRVAGSVADALYQAGGVLKVVLIIGIEMLAFPLYCGLLLDLALLPLFGGATVMSRLNFTLTSPVTSLFIHWFVGTCYMFHFALFVSMCRKILRPGVLHFIRDPDDPTFHPVRDVLERSVSTQLWKISFSALVYGGLVIVCLGGVVWGIAYSFANVLPIRWSSDEPVLEFPVDLLFYNFLMPLAFKFLKPDKGINKIFSWWFHRCGRALRLTSFLFGEIKEDDEFRQVSHTWRNMWRRSRRDSLASDADDTQQIPPHSQQSVESTPKPLQSGRYVRAPASDQVRIPKGVPTFLEVDENNNRLDGQPDADDGLHGRKNESFRKVYAPPLFRLRITTFVILLWLFGAATGISVTLVPLVFGRFVFATIVPNKLRMNDIYAYSIGIYILGGAVYGIVYRQRMADYIRETLTPHAITITAFFRTTGIVAIRVLGLIYTYAAFGIFLPALLSLLMEFYLIIPLHTYLSTTFKTLENVQYEHHIIHIIQDWTLGILYLKMAARLILNGYPNSRPAAALRGIVREGWLKPDVRLATRGFIFPATLVMGVVLAAPLSLGWFANIVIASVSKQALEKATKAAIYRYSYPGVLALGFTIATTMALQQAFLDWRKRVRDEVYLIGERLHNYGEARRRKKGKERAA